MRYILLVCAFLFALPVTVFAETAKTQGATEAVVSEGVDNGDIRHINTNAPSALSEEEPAARPRPMEQWETYDENTGLPDVTESDASYEFE